MSVLMIKRNIKKRANGFFSNFSFDGEKRNELSDDERRVYFLTSGTLTVKSPVVIDVFLVGGGGSGSGASSSIINYAGGGGGGGYTLVANDITLRAGEMYPIVIGDGGVKGYILGGDGGSTSAFGYTADGGKGGGLLEENDDGTATYRIFYGGAGGSGGGSGAELSSPYGWKGGELGSDGREYRPSNYPNYNRGIGGKGQGRSTAIFENNEHGPYFAGGGSGGSSTPAIVTGALGGGGASGENGEPNTGGGGGGITKTTVDGTTKTIGPGNGGSGVVVIRLKRWL